MGCTSNKNVDQRKYSIDQINKNSNGQILKKPWTCPNCLEFFKQGSSLKNFQTHLSDCILHGDDKDKDTDNNNDRGGLSNLQRRKMKKQENQFIYYKNPDDNQSLRHSWSKVQQNKSILKIKISTNLSKEQIKSKEFQFKLKWFRTNIQKLRINWQQGCEWLQVTRKNVLMSSMAGMKRLNLHKQLKIKLSNEKANDAGGLLRQWVHLINKQIFSQQLGIFLRADTDEVTYKLRPCSQIDAQFACQILNMYGKILGKSIFQKIPITTYLDRTILRYLTGQKIQLKDINSYDKNLYVSWNYILSHKISQSQTPTNKNQISKNQFNFTIMLKDHLTSLIQDKQLIQNGKNIYVTQQNKKDFVEKCIQFLCVTQVQPFLKSIKNGFISVIPQKFITVFDPHQLQMILYGIPFIDILQWEQNTEYGGAYHVTHKNIIWFWQFMREQTQQRLGKFLHFCTGSSRTPINGFKKLQTNRGQSSKFKIQSSIYSIKDPYPKGHTCFNRLQLPVYPNKQKLIANLNFILDSDFQGVYGLD